jgi:hypothetical protein
MSNRHNSIENGATNFIKPDFIKMEFIILVLITTKKPNLLNRDRRGFFRIPGFMTTEFHCMLLYVLYTYISLLVYNPQATDDPE